MKDYTKDNLYHMAKIITARANVLDSLTANVNQEIQTNSKQTDRFQEREISQIIHKVQGRIISIDS